MLYDEGVGGRIYDLESISDNWSPTQPPSASSVFFRPVARAASGAAAAHQEPSCELRLLDKHHIFFSLWGPKRKFIACCFLLSLRSGTGWAYYFPSTPSSVLSCVFCLLLSASAAGTRFIISPTHCSFGQHTLISVSFCPGGLVHSYTWFHLVPHSLMLNGSAVCVRVCAAHVAALVRLLFATRFSSNKAWVMPPGPCLLSHTWGGL